jgi:hypothetical protein
VQFEYYYIPKDILDIMMIYFSLVHRCSSTPFMHPAPNIFLPPYVQYNTHELHDFSLLLRPV